jgi:general secretion pathway protein K
MLPTAHRQKPCGHRKRQNGAALLVAMLIVSLVATLAAGMVWQQWRAIEVETAERAHEQSSWLLAGALDWARLILREDAREGGADALTEPWATGLAEIRLSTFLAVDQNHNTDPGLDAFLSGEIVDAQSRYNLYNLISDDVPTAAAELRILGRLCDTLGLPPQLAARIAEGMNSASVGEDQIDEGQSLQAFAPVRPLRVEQLRWLGIDDATIARLRPFVMILPQRTTVNINTAPVEVLVAVIENLDKPTAQRLVQQRAQLKKGFDQLTAAKVYVPEKVVLDQRNVGIMSNHFEITGLLRYEDSVLREVSVVQRRGQDVRVLWRDRISS